MVPRPEKENKAQAIEIVDEQTLWAGKFIS